MASGLKEEALEFKKNRILEVAGQLFFQKGFTSTTLDEIAAALSVTKPFIYQFYAAKADLLAAVCLRTTALAADRAKMAREDRGTPSERLERFVRSLAHEVIDGRTFLAVYFREEKHLPAAARQRLQDDHRRFNRALLSLLEEGRALGDFEINDPLVAMEAITGMTTWAFFWFRPDGRLTASQVADELATIAMRVVKS
ncbi:TetR family transcriptional regulator [Sulfitobacter pacificus]|uniref:TetR family transcriptional regulator n=1 Tax=Sulfitobacter pacificus TaxID=1499314 RepID=A0ABQ5VPZ0_9RHOB|nr:TetR family transcriptional regulator [Sulfitobacter pacificus]